jgi:hypothetical protein
MNLNIPTITFPQSLTAPRGSGHAIIDIDLDGVCADYTTAMRTICAKEFNISEESIPEPNTYNLVSATGWPIRDRKTFLRIHTKAVADHLYRKIPIFPGTKEAFHYLSDSGFHIRIATHRLISSGLHQIVVSDTAAWLEEHHLPYMSLCFVGPKDTLDANLHIEDSPSVASNLVRANQQTVLMDRTYNRSITGVPRVHSWDELTRAIELHLTEARTMSPT